MGRRGGEIDNVDRERDRDMKQRKGEIIWIGIGRQSKRDAGGGRNTGRHTVKGGREIRYNRGREREREREMTGDNWVQRLLMISVDLLLLYFVHFIWG